MAAQQDSSKHGGHPHFKSGLTTVVTQILKTVHQQYKKKKGRRERKGEEEEEQEEGRELELELKNFYLTRIVV